MPESPRTFADLMTAARASRNPGLPGQWTPTACQIWRDADPEDARLLEAALAWELLTGRLARPEDEPTVRERRRLMDEATARAGQEGGKK
jgi:hypothetical protein